MAGIGFALRALTRNETLSSVVAASAQAAIIAAGPWLFTIASLTAITATSGPAGGHAVLETFRAVIIYAFATSLTLAAPVTIVATRLLADQLWQRRTDRIRPLLVAAMALAVAAVATGVGLIVVYFAVPFALAVSLMMVASIVAMIWVAVAFCGAVRDYNGITLSFLLGLVISIAASTAAALLGWGAAGMVWGFALGLTITLFGLSFRVLATFPQSASTAVAEFKVLLAGARPYALLAAGALFGTAGIWVDKWVFWFSPEGQAVKGGLIHAPLYDSAMFIASLVIIPALAQFVIKLETDFFDRYQNYYGTIKDHGTIDQIERARSRLQTLSFESLALIVVAHAAIATVMILAAPAIVESLNLQFRQIAILRYGALGAVFQFIFIAATSMIVFFDRRGLYCALQLLFLILNCSLTAVSISYGEDYYGVGYFCAAFISAAIALAAAESTFNRLNYLTFVGNNPSITGPRRSLTAWTRETLAQVRR